MAGTLVLCGPMVRRVEARSAAIFLALRRPRTVRLRVFADDAGEPGATLMAGEAETIPLGPGLHVVVVVAQAPTPVPWGTPCLYDLEFVSAGGREALGDRGVIHDKAFPEAVDRLVYGDRALPGFMLPPADPQAIRFAHGSCRKPHGAGRDALTQLDRVIRQAHQRGIAPPQQLFLTGDQIYADDVHPAMLQGVMQVEEALIGAGERAAIRRDLGAGALGLGARASLVKTHAGFTSGAASNHLVTLGEFAAMYLLAWSPTAWADSGIDTDGPLDGFHDGLPRVRRALANVATYMLFDDHEVTDDWNIRGDWVESVSGLPLGRRIVRNALAAYAVFQHWGNAPAEFAPGRPGARVLTALRDRAGDGAPASLDGVLGGLPDQPQALAWSWRWRNPTYEVVGLDTRTRRGFPARGKFSMLPIADINRLLATQGATPDFSVVISPAPLLGVKLIEAVQKLAAERFSDEGVLKYDFEPWTASKTYDAFVNRLLYRSPALVLSGDVHYAYVASLVVKAGVHKGRRIVNCTSSALKNQSGGLVKFGWGLGGDRPHAAGQAEAEPENVIREIEIEGDDGAFVAEEEVFGGAFDLPGDLADLEPQLDTSNKRTPVLARANLGDITFPEAGRMRQVLRYQKGEQLARTDEASFPMGRR